MDENLDKLLHEMKNRNIKITFGLQPNHIEAIEKEFKRWNDMPALASFPNESVDPKYIKYVWERLGEELHWEPFTLCLYYFEYLEEINKKP